MGIIASEFERQTHRTTSPSSAARALRSRTVEEAGMPMAMAYPTLRTSARTIAARRLPIDARSRADLKS
jgi:hypothetical protein